jgi:hypothetical protein
MLAKAVEGATRPSQAITWAQADGAAMDLTGATLTGRIKNLASGAARNVAGTLSVTDAAAGEFTWAYHADDVAEAGKFEVQFTAAYGVAPSPARTFRESWIVESYI